MKKSFNSKVYYNGKPARITATVTDENGYISITGEIIPYRCKTVHAAGCLHEYIYMAFPKLRPFIWLHLVNLDGTIMYEVENSLYMLANDDVTAAQSVLGCSDDEIDKLYNLVRFGLHRSKTSWGYRDHLTGYQISDENSVQTYTAALNKLGLRSRRLHAINDLYGVLSAMGK